MPHESLLLLATALIHRQARGALWPRVGRAGHVGEQEIQSGMAGAQDMCNHGFLTCQL